MPRAFYTTHYGGCAGAGKPPFFFFFFGKPPFCNHHVKDWIRQEASMEAPPGGN